MIEDPESIVTAERDEAREARRHGVPERTHTNVHTGEQVPRPTLAEAEADERDCG